MKREYSKTPNGALERWSVGACKVFLDEKIRAICGVASGSYRRIRGS